MYDRLLTLIRVDLANNGATIFVRGRFTATNYRALVPLIRRAHALPGNPIVTVNITRASAVEPDAIRLLMDACRSAFLHTTIVQVRTTDPTASRLASPMAA